MISITSDAAAVLVRNGLSAEHLVDHGVGAALQRGVVDAVDLLVRWLAEEPDALCALRKPDGTVWLGTLGELQAVLQLPPERRPAA